MPSPRRRSGPPLPYRPLAGVVPCPGGWLTVSGKLIGTTLAPDGVVVHERLADVLEHRPGYEIIALHAPVGLPSRSTPGGRLCDHEARALLGFSRGGSVMSAPPRSVLRSRTYEAARRKHPALSAVEFGLLPRIAEVDELMQPYLQRTVHETHPELSFHQLNGGTTLRHPKHTTEGRAERRRLLESKLPALAGMIDRRLPGTTIEHRIDAAAGLWTARRIASRGVLRVPPQPDWDEHGLRMEILR
jgi:predicted RNase H-like nuclease